MSKSQQSKSENQRIMRRLKIEREIDVSEGSGTPNLNGYTNIYKSWH